MEAMDMNVFLIINGMPVHIATMGSRIPDVLNDSKRVIETWRMVKELPYSSGFSLNGKFISDNVINSGYEYLSKEGIGDMNDMFRKFPSFDSFPEDTALPVKLFSWSFVDMARRGFYSFARVEENNEDVNGDVYFFLVAKPDDPIRGLEDRLISVQINDLNIEPLIETERIPLFGFINNKARENMK